MTNRGQTHDISHARIGLNDAHLCLILLLSLQLPSLILTAHTSHAIPPLAGCARWILGFKDKDEDSATRKYPAPECHKTPQSQQRISLGSCSERRL